MLFIKNKNRFMETYFGDNYKKTLVIENGEKLSSLQDNLLALENELKELINKDSESFAIEGKRILEMICLSYGDNDYLLLSELEKEIIQDVRDYKMPIMQFASSCYSFNVNQGWWTDIETKAPLNKNRKEIVSLIVSEVFEALDAERKPGMKDKKLTERGAVEVEMADAVIRIMDYSGRYQMDFFSPYLKELSKEKGKTFTEIMEELSSFIDDSENASIMYQESVKNLGVAGFETNIDAIGQLHAFQRFCKGKTEINRFENPFEALLKIASTLSSISELTLSSDGDYETQGDKIEVERISKALAMIFDYTESRDIDLIPVIVEKIIFNSSREDHRIENRLKPGGKIN